MFSEFYSSIEKSIQELEESINDEWIENCGEIELFLTFLNKNIYSDFKNNLSKHFGYYNIKFEDNIYLKTFSSVYEKYKPNIILKKSQ